MKRWITYLPLIVLIVAPSAMLYTVWVDPLSAGEDDVVYYAPLRALVGEALAGGEWPMANPYEATGTAVMGDPQSAVLYPPTWLFAVLPLRTAYAISIVLAFALAGLGAFLYLRRIGLLPIAALFGALAFAFSGFMVGHRVHLAMIHTAAFLPWGLWCIEGLRNVHARGGAEAQRPWGAVLWLVWVLTLAVASGHWPALVHMLLIWGVYFLVRARPFLPALGRAVLAGGLALLLVGPQLYAGFHLFDQATRQGIGYSLAAENSFFPPALLLVFFPFLMGSRTPNLFDQAWWGPSHLCEMLAYVGLVTLIFAVAAVRILYRRPRTDVPVSDEAARHTSIVRLWTWIGIGAFVFMLGYFTPVYWLVHKVPILGVVRCPARMSLALDLSLAVLAAVALHQFLGVPDGERTARLKKTLRRTACVGLPVAMVVLLLLAASIVLLLPDAWAEAMPWPMVGGTDAALSALSPGNPAVWLPLALCVVTALAVAFWLRRPRRRALLLVGLLLLDLFVITRFVDVPGTPGPALEPTASPVSKLLADPEVGDPDTYRVWAVTDSYTERPGELLLPKPAHALGHGTINGYGPFQAHAHTQLFEFRLWGVVRTWERLVRRNHLLSLYGVRYLLVTDPERRRVIESVVMPGTPPPSEGANLLDDAEAWRCSGSEHRSGVLHLSAPWVWPASEAVQEVRLAPETLYRIALDARSPEGCAGNTLSAGIVEPLLGRFDFDNDPLALLVYADQVDRDWRHFEWVFTTPVEVPDLATFRIQTFSERPIEVRNVSLRTSHVDMPVSLGTRVGAGESVYAKVADVPALDGRAPPVSVYENRQWRPVGSHPLAAASSEEIEELKWRPGAWLTVEGRALPTVGLSVPAPPTLILLVTTLPGLLLYSLLLVTTRRRRRSTSR